MAKSNVKSNSKQNIQSGKTMGSTVIRLGDSNTNMAVAFTPKTPPPPKKVNK